MQGVEHEVGARSDGNAALQRGRRDMVPGGASAWRGPERARGTAAGRQHRLERAQLLGRGHAGPQRGGDPAFEHVAGEAGEFAREGIERRAFHLAQLDAEHLQHVTVAIHRGRAPAFGRIHQALHHVEANGALGRPRARRDVDGDDTGCLEHGARERREIPKTPRRERVIGAQREERIARCGNVRRCDERDGHGDGIKLMT